MKKHNVPALYGLDTRSLTKRIREHGAVLGKIELANQVRCMMRTHGAIGEQQSRQDIFIYIYILYGE